MDLNQKRRFSNDELELIKSTFSGKGEEMLYSLRDLFLQLSDEVPTLSKEIIPVLRKMLYPTLEKEVPLGQQADNYISLSNINQIPPEVAYIHILAKDKAVQYLDERFRVLEGETVEDELILQGFKTAGDKSESERVIDMMAYTFLVNAYIESCLIELRTLANAKEETVEEIAKREKLNSTK